MEHLLHTDCFQNLSRSETGDINVYRSHKQTSTPHPFLAVLKQNRKRLIFTFCHHSTVEVLKSV